MFLSCSLLGVFFLGGGGLLLVCLFSWRKIWERLECKFNLPWAGCDRRVVACLASLCSFVHLRTKAQLYLCCGFEVLYGILVPCHLGRR